MRNNCYLFEKLICEFESTISEGEINRIKPEINEEVSGLWAMYGMDSNNKEVCIEIGSSRNIYNEIRYNLKTMISRSEKKMVHSYFHQDVYEFETYMDKHSFKYRSIYENYKNIKIYKMNIDNFIAEDLNDEMLLKYIDYKINYAEVKLALLEKPMYWNPAPQTNRNREKEILQHKQIVVQKIIGGE